MDVAFSEDEGPRCTMSWKTRHGFKCCITLAPTHEATRLDVTVHCFGPGTGQIPYARGHSVGDISLEAGPKELQHHLERAKEWANGLKETVGDDGRPSLAPILDGLRSARWGPRLMAVFALTRLAEAGDHRTITPLAQTLGADPSPDVRAAAATGLARFHDPRGVSALRSALVDQDPSVRGNAALSLVRLGHADGLQPLTELIRQHLTPRGLGSGEILPGLGVREVVWALAGAMRNLPAGPAAAAARTLAFFRTHAVDALIGALASPEPEVRVEAARSLGLVGGPRAIGPLEQVAHDEVPLVSAAAKGAIARISETI